ncbi:MAG: HAMP domain-containing sensor histidine kinase, partial [Bacteroidota bacterium]
ILEFYLKEEFKSKRILIDFEYGIYDCNIDKMIYGDYIAYSEEPDEIKPTILPKCDKFTYYFGVFFPSRSSHIAGDMGIWYFFSSILLIVIIFFSYSIFIIFKQKRLSEIQTDFINNMTHEFKTPLTSISISADVISDKKIINDPDRLFKYIQIIKEQNDRLRSQVEKVLEMAAIDKKMIKIAKSDIFVNELIIEIVKGFIEGFKENYGTINLDEIGEEVLISADKIHFTNLILNILDNSYKYAVEKPEISISKNIQKKDVMITFSDNGIGIKKEYLKKIFEKFYRVHTGNQHDVKGFGLGLNYVYHVVKAHGWKIKVTSTEGKGSIFTIVIPLIKNDNEKS